MPLLRAEVAYAQAGRDQLAGRILPRNVGALPIPAFLAGAPISIVAKLRPSVTPEMLKWVLRLPFVAIGWLLGASVWYVARRLYGDAGGYIALTLFCFSPGIGVGRGNSVLLFLFAGPLLTGSLGLFGTVFVSIAAAHTLYARPKNALLEMRARWRRILLLGISLALAEGSGYGTLLLVVLAAGFMLYLVPERRLASLGLVVAACLTGAVILWACFGFHARAFAAGIRQAEALPGRDMAPAEAVRKWLAGMGQSQNTALLLLTVIALLVYVMWPRCRYFGTTAPLLTLLLITGLSFLVFPDLFSGLFAFRALPFQFVFIGGIFADLLESRWRRQSRWLIAGLLVAYAAQSLITVAQRHASVLY